MRKYLYVMKKGDGPQQSVGPSKSVLVYALHSLEKRPRPGSISGVCAIIIITIIFYTIVLLLYFSKMAGSSF